MRPPRLSFILLAVGLMVGLLPATASAATGSIAGRVTGESGQPLSGVCVRALQPDGSEGGFERSSPDGSYVLEGLETATYQVEFYDCQGGRHLTEWYDDKRYREEGDLVSVVDGQQTSGVDIELALGASIEGTVTDAAGEPLHRVCVTARGSGFDSHGFTTTDPAGVYRITRLRTDSYELEFNDCDWDQEQRRYVHEWYDDQPLREDAETLEITQGESYVGVDAELAIGGSISGTITGSGGVPLPGICVYAYDRQWHYGDTETSDSGRYEIIGLGTGEYVVGFYDCGAGGHLEEVFDGFPGYGDDDYTPVSVTVGRETAGIDASLVKGGSISGRVTDVAGAPLEDICAYGYDGEDQIAYAYSNASGEFRMRGLPAAAVTLKFQDCVDEWDPSREGRYAPEWFDGATRREDATAIPVELGEEVTGVEVGLDPGGAISGSVTGPTGAAPERACVEAYDEDHEWLAWTLTEADGTYSLEALPTGLVRVRVEDCNWDGDTRLATEWYRDAASWTSATPVAVEAGAVTAGVDLRMDPGGSISGTVTVETPQSYLSVDVYAYDDAGDFVDYAYVNGDGSYRIDGLGSGSYRLWFYCFSRCAGEWYADAAEEEDADPVPVVSGVDTPGIDVALGRVGIDVTESDGATRVEEAGAGDSYSLALLSRPRHPVEVVLRPSKQVSAAPSRLTFTPEDWSVPQAVTVTATDDDVIEAEHAGWIDHDLRSDDWDYGGPEERLNVSILDDDTDAVPVSLSDLGPTTVTRGQPAAMTARLRDVAGEPIPGAILRFKMGGNVVTALTDGSGLATATLPVGSAAGRYRLKVTYAGDEVYEPDGSSAWIDARWSHTFLDEGGSARVFLDPTAKQFAFFAPGDESAVKTDPSMRIDTLPTGERVVTIAYADDDLTVTGHFNLDTGVFAAAVKSPAAPYALRAT